MHGIFFTSFYLGEGGDLSLGRSNIRLYSDRSLNIPLMIFFLLNQISMHEIMASRTFKLTKKVLNGLGWLQKYCFPVFYYL